jgi:hypothetical protein
MGLRPIRLPWRHRARPSATLHEIQVGSEEQTCSKYRTCHKNVCQALAVLVHTLYLKLVNCWFLIATAVKNEVFPFNKQKINNCLPAVLVLLLLLVPLESELNQLLDQVGIGEAGRRP